MLWSLAFWKGAAERAIKTFAQVVAALIGVDVMGIHAVDWVAVASAAALAAFVSLVTSIGNADFVAGPPTATVEGYVGEHRVSVEGAAEDLDWQFDHEHRDSADRLEP